MHFENTGQKVPHPPSTNFDGDFATPAAKRIKVLDHNDSSASRRGVDDSASDTKSDSEAALEIPDSEAESDSEEIETPARRTNLENALPPVKTDKEAIQEYEASRAAEQAEPANLHERLESRKWIRGRNSIYVDAFQLALDTVLEDESHLFDEAELAVFKAWQSLSYEGKYLYVRLFLRKSAAWHRVNRLGYHSDIGDLDKAVSELFESRMLPEVNSTDYSHPGELNVPTDTIFGTAFSFADSSDDHIDTLEEASSLLLLDELKDIAKDARVQGKTKSELLKAFRENSQKQSGIAWRGLKRSETEESIKSEVSTGSNILEEGDGNRDAHYVGKILSSTGKCIRLSAAPFKLFERVHLVFYRSTEWTEKSLTTIILAKISRRNFPDYIVSRSTNIFPSRSMLLEFEASIRTQFRVDNILEYSGTVTKDGLLKVREIADEVYPRWKTLLADEQRKEDREYDIEEGAYLRRFSPAWVYTRIIHKGLDSLGRFKEHAREHSLLTELLEQRLFHGARRGAWYQRKALLEQHYMWALSPSEGRNEEAQKRNWRVIALKTCEDGLQDRECHLIYHYDLQKRVMKLERALRIAKRQQHDFSHVILAKPSERTFRGIRIERSSRSSASTPKGRSSTPTRGRAGGKTIWLDEREGGGECSVEEMCLSQYRELGYKGFHIEGGLVRTLFGLLFYDVLFAYAPNVFQTEFQTCPLDLHTDAFFAARFSEIAHQLARLSNGESLVIFTDVWERLSERQVCVVGVDWSIAKEDLEEILRCFPGEALAVVCKVMAQEYQQRGGGIPDLFLWHPDENSILFAEVKSENDRLSDTQRLWIHVLAGAGVKVELCNALASEVRTSD